MSRSRIPTIPGLSSPTTSRPARARFEIAHDADRFAGPVVIEWDPASAGHGALRSGIHRLRIESPGVTGAHGACRGGAVATTGVWRGGSRPTEREIAARRGESDAEA